MPKDREIEVKLVVTEKKHTLSNVARILERFSDKIQDSFGFSSYTELDYYWDLRANTLYSVNDGYIRLRRIKDCCQADIKVNDKETDFDRKCLQLGVNNSFEDAFVFFTELFGPYATRIQKRRYNFELSKLGVVISAYKACSNVFIEIEGGTAHQVYNTLQKFFHHDDGTTDIKVVTNSIYDMYVRENTMKITDVNAFLLAKSWR